MAATPAGRGLVDEATAGRRREISRIVGAMTTESQQFLTDALRAFADAVGEVPEHIWSAGWE